MLSVSHALSFIIPNNSVRPIVCVITAILTMRKEKKNNLESIFPNTFELGLELGLEPRTQDS